MSYLSLVVFLVIVLAAAASGAYFSPGEWYSGLHKPSWTPPDRLFPIAWSVLYIMIALAGWLVWRVDSMHPAMFLWAVQLVLNAAWSWLFFGRHDMVAALVDIGALGLSIAAFIVAALPISPLASALFVPYLLWVGFAAALNYRVWQLNA
ncbi:MAG: TspO/MBR family protein [Dichotomicrobium sp.]